MRAKCYIFIFALAFLTSCASRPILDMLGPPVTRDELAGNWVGQDGSGTFYYYLVLRGSGDGVLVSSDETSPPQVYRVRAWNVERREITITLLPEDVEKDPISVTATTRQVTLTLEIRGLNWQQTCTLSREEALDKKLAISKEAAKSALANGKWQEKPAK
ncbi:MAG: hypothetical protein JWR26_4614 [Pedosphaera sp.]|nr:hypothetical protein [Pedosphaera sp.]